MMQQGSWAVLGMEIECVFLRLLPSVPSIAFDQHHKPFPFFRRTSHELMLILTFDGVKKKQAKNSQCQPIHPIHDKLQQTYNCVKGGEP